MDDNQYMMMQIGWNDSDSINENQENLLEYRKNDEKEGIKVYLDTIGSFQNYRAINILAIKTI